MSRCFTKERLAFQKGINAINNYKLTILALKDSIDSLLVAHMADRTLTAKEAIAHLGFAKSVGIATKALQGQSAALATVFTGAAIAAIAVIYLTVKAVNALTTSIEEQQKKVEELTESYDSICSEIEKLSSKQLSPFDTDLTQDEKDRLEYLEKYRDSLKETLGIESALLTQKKWFNKGNPWSWFQPSKSDKINEIETNNSIYQEEIQRNLEETERYLDDINTSDAFKKQVSDVRVNNLTDIFNQMQSDYTKLLQFRKEIEEDLANEFITSADKGILEEEKKRIDNLISSTKTSMIDLYRTNFVDAPASEIAKQLQESFKKALGEDSGLKEKIDELKDYYQFFTSDDVVELASLDVNTEAAQQKLKELADNWNALTNGNVDYNERPILHPEDLVKAGYKDFEGEDPNTIITTLTEGFWDNVNNTKGYIDITPIVNGKEILSHEQLEDYVNKLWSTDDPIFLDKPENGGKGILINYWKEATQEEIDAYQANLDIAKGIHAEYVDTINDPSVIESLKEIATEYGVTVREVANAVAGLDPAVKPQLLSLEQLSSVLQTISDKTDILGTAYKEMAEDGSLSIETITKLIAADSEWASMLDVVNGKITVNKEALVQAAKDEILQFKTKAEAAVESAKIVIKALQDEIDALAIAKADAADVNDVISEKMHLLIAPKKQLEDANKQIKIFDGLISSLDGSDPFKELGKSAADAAKKVKEAANTAKSAIESLLTMTVNMIKQRYNDEKDEYEKEKDIVKDRYDEEKKEIEELIDAYKKKIDAQKEALEQEKEANDYNKSIAEKNADISKLEGQIAEVSNDTSAEGIKKRLELEEELVEKKSDLADYQADHAYDTAVDALDKEYERYEEIHQAELDDVDEEYNDKVKQLDRQIKAIEDYTNNVANLNNEAFDLMQGRSNEYYEDLLEWNRQYGDGVDESIRVAWINAYKSLDTFGLGEKDVLQILNELVSATNDFKLEIDGVTDSLGGATDAATQLAKAYGQIAEAKQEMLDAEGVPYDRGEYDRVIIEAQQKLKLKGYSTGGVVTSTAPAMLHGTSSSPEVVLNNAQASQLFSLINNAPSMITSIATKALDNIKSTFGQNYKGSLGNNSVPSVVIGDINITGNADSNTVQMLKQWQNDTVNKITNILTRKI